MYPYTFLFHFLDHRLAHLRPPPPTHIGARLKQSIPRKKLSKMAGNFVFTTCTVDGFEGKEYV